MKFLVNRFEEKFKQPVAITVRFFDENPFTVRQARYNQGGLVCYCMDGSTEGKQNIKNEWKTIECKEDCQYRMKKGQRKAMCNKEGTLKFMLPEICVDKIWCMKINGRTSIEILRDYISFQKEIGNSLIGDYVIFLKEVEHSVEGNKFKNKVIDIIRKEDFISNNQINLQNQNNQAQLSTNQVKNVEKNTENLEVTASKSNITQDNEIETQVEQKTQHTTQKVEANEKKVTKKATKTKKESKKEPTETEQDAELNSKFKNYHILIETKTKMLTKDGKPTEYVFATFTNTDDKTVEVIIPPKYAEELKQCDLGTSVLLDLQRKGDKTFTNSIEYIDKCIKDVAA